MFFHDGINEYLMPLRTLPQTFARLDVHRRMLADRVRVDAFARAIAAQVRPGDVVVEIGCGVGLLSILAARAGARRVYAVEVTELAELAREIVQANGLQDRVEVVRGLSSEVTLPEPGDVLISETLGHIGVDEGIVAVMADARARLLKPDARLIPRGIEVVLAPTSDAALDQLELSFWRERLRDVNLAPAAQAAAERVYQRPVHETALVARPQVSAQVDLSDDEVAPASYEASFVLRGAAEVHGLAAWFEADLGAGVTVCSRETSSWLPLLFPLEPPLTGEGLQELRARVQQEPRGDEVAWSWLLELEGALRRGGRASAQTTG